MEGLERDDLKITVKVFLRSPDPVEAEKCLDAVMAEVGARVVERLIVAFPNIEVLYVCILRIFETVRKAGVNSNRLFLIFSFS